jgi:hypothetical protein
LIDPNENLAIFDNGNLYAKNAWIEGTINATDGKFTGEIEATVGKILGELIVGKQNETDEDFILIDGKTGIIKSNNYDKTDENGNKQGWMIDANGKAVFNELTVDVKIETDQLFSNMSISGNSYVTENLIVGDNPEVSQNYIMISAVGTPYIKSGNYNAGNTGWLINADGTAYFNDVNIAGVLKTATFQYGKIKTVGGAMLFRPSYEIEKVSEPTDGVVIITLKEDISDNPDFKRGCWIKKGTNLGSYSVPIYKINGVDGKNITITVGSEYKEDNIFTSGDFIVSVFNSDENE